MKPGYSGRFAAMAGVLKTFRAGASISLLEEGHVMALSFTVGGARGTFDGRFADEVAGVLDNAFGAEGEWEGSPPLHYGELADAGWSELQRRAGESSGVEAIPNLTASENKGAASICPPSFKPSRFRFQPAGRSGAPACSACATSFRSWPSAGSFRSMTRGCTTCCAWPMTRTTAGWPSRRK